jgi:hypothetical protein
MKKWRSYEIRNIFIVGDRAGVRLGGRVRDVSRRRGVDSLAAAIRRDISGDSFIQQSEDLVQVQIRLAD